MKPVWMFLAHDKKTNLVWGYFGYNSVLYEWLGKWCPEDKPETLRVQWTRHDIDARHDLRAIERDAIFIQVSLADMEKRVPGFEEKLLNTLVIEKLFEP